MIQIIVILASLLFTSINSQENPSVKLGNGYDYIDVPTQVPDDTNPDAAPLELIGPLPQEADIFTTKVPEAEVVTEAPEEPFTEAISDPVTEKLIKKKKAEKQKIKNKPIVHLHMNCSYLDHYCNPSAYDLITKIEDTDVFSPMECRDLCLDEPSCTDFTFFNFRGIQTCFLLSGCSDKKPRCTVPNSCVSGRRDCADGSFCPMLTQKPGEDIAWRCQGGINPYKEDIPEDTPCYTYCPSWRNTAGDVVAAKSICQADGSWSEPRAFPPGTLKSPKSLNKPDEEMMGCGCHPLNITYNPNNEDGAEFFCDREINWSKLPQKITTNNRCHLFCDKMLISITECKEGLWTGRPDLGFWCSRQAPAVAGWGTEEKLPMQITSKKRKSEQQARFKNLKFNKA